MPVLYAYSRTMAGAQRIAQAREPIPPTVEAPEPQHALRKRGQ